MKEDRRITGKVDVKDNGSARVAWDLMVLIGTKEARDSKGQDSREYWLSLMRECVRAVEDFPEE